MRVLIVDDEPLARKRIRNLLQNVVDFEVVGEAGNGPAALQLIRAHRPNLVFLDVQMPEMDGFGVIEALGNDHSAQFVFVTAYDDHAIRAFEVHAVDYLVKPFDDERFAACLDHLRQLGAANIHADRDSQMKDVLEMVRKLPSVIKDSQSDIPGGDRGRLIVHDRGRSVFIPIEDIDWIRAQGVYAAIHTKTRCYLHRQTMQRLEEQLSAHRFLRIHRSSIVNTDRIHEIQPCTHGEYIVTLYDGTELRSSRSYREQMHRLIRGI